MIPSIPKSSMMCDAWDTASLHRISGGDPLLCLSEAFRSAGQSSWYVTDMNRQRPPQAAGEQVEAFLCEALTH
ncbi:hypothetical protein ACFLIM_23965 [Nonomuraea sp. M3C6]|uniref:Uncharacterized protein n=1 Tax=Nonomuraea marmarensis TaxID=3351344 RepID=A0ABW7AIK2_9ACTN